MASDDALIEAMARAIHDVKLGGARSLHELSRVLATAALAAIRKTHAVVSREPSDGLLMSMALRYDHGLGLPGYYDMSGVAHAQRLASALVTMRQLHEEVVGTGFYKPERDGEYRIMLAASEEAKP